jgi:uncharacterized membrane protein
MSSRRRGRPVISRDWTKSESLVMTTRPLPIGDVYKRPIGSAIAIGQVEGVPGVVAGLFQPIAETLGQLRVYEKLHAADGTTIRLTCRTRAA